LYRKPSLQRTPAERGGGHVLPTSYFSADYFAARSRFVAAVRRLGWEQQAIYVDAPSPNGEPLSIDVGVAGDATAERALVVTSGVHGVEGPFGSAVQLAFLDRLASGWRPPSGTSLVMIHAVNPYGFAWRRRFNEDNIDLNRNFLLANEEYAGSPPLCGAFRRMMLRTGLPRRMDLATARMAMLAMRHGLRSFWETLPVGQYDFPDWLFFGGRARSQSAEAIQNLAPQLFSSASEVVHLDFHTGLGRWGQAQLLLCELGEPGHIGWWQTHFGAEHVKEPSVEKGAYQVRGGFGRWLKAQMPNCRYRFATAEFGTYSPARVIRALLRELFYHSHSGPQAQQADHWSRRQLSEAFVPRSNRWRTASLSRGVALIDRAMAVLWQSPDGVKADGATAARSVEQVKTTSPNPPACSQTA
jgi:hypothetical protein